MLVLFAVQRRLLLTTLQYVTTSVTPTTLFVASYQHLTSPLLELPTTATTWTSIRATDRWFGFLLINAKRLSYALPSPGALVL